MEELPTGKRITLHRVPTVTKPNQIQENLHTLKVNMRSKQIAQKHYYENSARSPLLQDTIASNKLPVHQRLGTTMRRKTVYNFNPNIRNKRMKPNNNMNTIGMRKNLAQARLQKIRQQRISENVLNNSTLFSKIRLRRNPQPNPVNYKILIKNEIASTNNEMIKMHSVHRSLTTELQHEIKLIQLQNTVSPNIIPNTPLIPVGYGFTGKSLHDRFLSLP